MKKILNDAETDGHKQPDEMWCWGMPWCVVRDFVETRIITFEEYGLLTKIYLKGNRGGPCWAGNGHLAEWWKKSSAHVSRTINKFIKLGLVRAQYIRKDKQIVRRYLWVIIQSPPPDSTPQHTCRPSTYMQRTPSTYMQRTPLHTC